MRIYWEQIIEESFDLTTHYIYEIDAHDGIYSWILRTQSIRIPGKDGTYDIDRNGYAKLGAGGGPREEHRGRPAILPSRRIERDRPFVLGERVGGILEND